MSYQEFLARKAQLTNAGGFTPTDLPDHLFDFQRALTEWAVRQGRGAIFADCGLGKTPMELAWAEQVHKHTGKPVLMLTPLARKRADERARLMEFVARTNTPTTEITEQLT